MGLTVSGLAEQGVVDRGCVAACNENANPCVVHPCQVLVDPEAVVFKQMEHG